MNPKNSCQMYCKALVVAVAATFASLGAAQTQPDAGRLMGTVKEPEPAPLRMAPSVEVKEDAKPAMPKSSLKVKVAGFRVSGNTVFSTDYLSSLLTPFVGQELDFAGLDKAASVLSSYYRDNGYFIARAYLPAQEVVAGIVEFAIIEGRVGKIVVQQSGESRLSEALAQGVVGAATVTGEPMKEAKIERGLLLLGDLPGLEVKSTIVPGATPGTSDLMVEVKEGRLVTGAIDADNYGNRFTGAARVGGTVNLNNPSGNGDLLSARVMSSGSGMNYGRLSYHIPLGREGTKVGAAYSHMRYSLQKDYSSLGANGNAGVASLFAAHPISRTRNSNLYVSAGYDYKTIRDYQQSANSQDKRIHVVNVGLSGDGRDGLWGGGIANWGVSVFGGRLDLGNNATAKANDAAAARSDGGYMKANFNASRLQRVTDQISIYGAVSGQVAGKNLDSSEKFTLGGLGVRAYPMGEAPGDSGYLANVEARYAVPGIDVGDLQLLGFLDHGGVTLHNNTWDNWQPTGQPGYPNSYHLTGTGVGVNFQKVGMFSLRTGYAWKLGSNPGRDTSNRDSDNTQDNGRLWMQATVPF